MGIKDEFLKWADDAIVEADDYLILPIEIDNKKMDLKLYKDNKVWFVYNKQEVSDDEYA